MSAHFLRKPNNEELRTQFALVCVTSIENKGVDWFVYTSFFKLALEIKFHIVFISQVTKELNEISPNRKLV